MDKINRKAIVLLLLGFLFLVPQLSLSAQNAWQGDNLTLKIAVIGPGDELYFWWGHIGLVAEDRVTGHARFYDWGAFSFDNENFFLNFAFGRLLYSCMVSLADDNYDVYIHRNRDITLYTLNLPANKKDEVLRFAEINMLPENCDYAYHHFKDNCATRIRDILDIALDGQFSAEYEEMPGRFTLRQHVRRHTWFNPFFDWILNFWMGQDIDRPITVWDDMFLPSEIAMRMEEFRYPNGQLLVSNVEIINKSEDRPVVLNAPRMQWPGALLVSLLFSELLLLLYLLVLRRNWFKKFLGITTGLLGLFFGIAGSMLFFMTFFTDHDYTYHNINILFVNPLLLAAIPLGLIFGFSESEKKRFVAARLLRALWAYVILGSLFTMVIKFFPAFYQQNQVTQALLMPIAITMVLIMTRLGQITNKR
ncbi:MAG: DUF4105 domain-containing protein [Treponema sp.]|nr:DUF4105 domain-containing protein [Treponema sp.]